jgi:Beta-glucosidase-related glycosidases
MVYAGHFRLMVDISRDPRWGRVSEGSGEDPYLGAQIAKAMVKGYQGKDFSDNTSIMACVKHFALYGAGEAGRDYNTVDMSRVRMYNEYFPPYKAAVDAGVGSVMTSFNEIDGIPATGNKWLMTDVLRKRMGRSRVL